eukprot:2474138-Ditylum_brightwellii.AAC.1
MAAKANTKTAGALLRGLVLMLRECHMAPILTLLIEGRPFCCFFLCPSPATGRILDKCIPTSRAAMVYHINMAWKVVSNGKLENLSASQYWQAWTMHCKELGSDPSLQDVMRHSNKANILMTFAARIRTSEFRNGNRVCHNSVDSVLWKIAQALVLLGLTNPRKAG